MQNCVQLFNQDGAACLLPNHGKNLRHNNYKSPHFSECILKENLDWYTEVSSQDGMKGLLQKL